MIIRTAIWGAITLAIAGWGIVPAAAQRGVGAARGVARLAAQPETTTLVGTLTAIDVGPCVKTTGRGRVGVHLLLTPTTSPGQEQTADSAASEPLNVHVGPASVVADVLRQFPVGTELTVTAFRTDRMPPGHFVATTIASAEQDLRLRDESLRPTWAGAGQAMRGRGGPGRDSGWAAGGRGGGRGAGGRPRGAYGRQSGDGPATGCPGWGWRH